MYCLLNKYFIPSNSPLICFTTNLNRNKSILEIIPSKEDVISPVSYTHLDVYKRQPLHLIGSRFHRTEENKLLRRRTQEIVINLLCQPCIDTVSYTHLDVYKRQIKSFSCNQTRLRFRVFVHIPHLFASSSHCPTNSPRLQT